MGNIYSYLKWRGDLGFSERPFCEVDNLVLAQLSYLDFTGIVPTVDEGGSITVEEAAEKYRHQKSWFRMEDIRLLCLAWRRRIDLKV